LAYGIKSVTLKTTDSTASKISYEDPSANWKSKSGN